MARFPLSNMIRTELRFLLPRALIFDAALYIISLPLYKFGLEVPLGFLLGTVVMLLNFIILGIFSEHAVERRAGGAKTLMFISYLIRYLICGLAFIAGVKFSRVNLAAVVIPQFYPKLAYTIDAAVKKRKGG